MKPEILVCDEPISALDVSVQAQILNLLMSLQEEYQLSLIFIAHDLNVVRHIAHRVMVMYMGKVVEIGERQQVMEQATHPYTKALLASTPQLNKGPIEVPLQGELPSPLFPPNGCSFCTRCPLTEEKCRTDEPELRLINERFVACHLV